MSQQATTNEKIVRLAETILSLRKNLMGPEIEKQRRIVMMGWLDLIVTEPEVDKVILGNFIHDMLTNFEREGIPPTEENARRYMETLKELSAAHFEPMCDVELSFMQRAAVEVEGYDLPRYRVPVPMELTYRGIVSWTPSETEPTKPYQICDFTVQEAERNRFMNPGEHFDGF